MNFLHVIFKSCFVHSFIGLPVHSRTTFSMSFLEALAKSKSAILRITGMWEAYAETRGSESPRVKGWSKKERASSPFLKPPMMRLYHWGLSLYSYIFSFTTLPEKECSHVLKRGWDLDPKYWRPGRDLNPGRAGDSRLY